LDLSTTHAAWAEQLQGAEELNPYASTARSSRRGPGGQ
jgi:hypothetical protein